MDTKIQDLNNIKENTKKLYNELHTSMNEFISQNEINLDCESGCSLCCKVISRIELLPTEAFILAAHLQDILDKNQLDNLIEKLYINAEKLKNKDILEAKKEFTPCPLLIDDRCSIYEVRPFTCRMFVSKSFDLCINTNCTQGHIDGILKFITEKQFYEHYVKTIFEADLYAYPIELNDALYTILTNNDSFDRYFKNKENIFIELFEIKQALKERDNK